MAKAKKQQNVQDDPEAAANAAGESPARALSTGKAPPTGKGNVSGKGVTPAAPEPATDVKAEKKTEAKKPVGGKADKAKAGNAVASAGSADAGRQDAPAPARAPSVAPAGKAKGAPASVPESISAAKPVEKVAAAPTKSPAHAKSPAPAKPASPATPATAPRPAAGAVPLFDTNLTAAAAANMLVHRDVLGAGAAPAASTTPAVPARVEPARQESATFKQLKQGLNKSAGGVAGVGGLLGTPPGQKKSNLPFGGSRQSFRNQTFGADVNRSGVPRRTGG